MKSFDMGMLPALDALLRTCSVSEAAKMMHLSTPAMSHTLARLRESLGDPLLVRSGRNLVPTPRALALIEPVSKLLEQANNLVSQDEQKMASLKRTFVIRSPEGVSVVFGAQLSIALQTVMPLSRIEFVSDSHGDERALREGQIDLDIGYINQKYPELKAEALVDQTLVGAVKPAHPLLARKITPKRFAAERHVGVTLRNNEHSPVDDALQAHGYERFLAITVHSSYGALIVAARSTLVATVPEVMAKSMKRFIPLELFALPFEVPKVTMSLAWHPRFQVDPAHRELRNCVRQVLSRQNWETPSSAQIE